MPGHQKAGGRTEEIAAVVDNFHPLIETIGAVRSAVGDGMQLMLDPASKLQTFADAYRMGRACDDNGYLWYEDPYRDTGVSMHGHGQLKKLLRTPSLLTEHVRGLEQHVDFMASGATDFVRADAEYDAGFTGAMKIAHAAEGLGSTWRSTRRDRCIAT